MLHNYLLGPDELSPLQVTGIVAGIVIGVLTLALTVLTTLIIPAVVFCYKRRKGMPDYKIMYVDNYSMF